MNVRALTLVSVLIPLVFTVSLNARTWTSTEGKKIEAEFVSGDSKKVTINRGGRNFTLPLSNLSPADQEFARGKIKSMAPGKGTEPPGRKAPVSIKKPVIDTNQPWEPIKQNIESTVNSAREKTIEDLVEPVHTTRFGGEDHLIWAPNPDGKT